MKSKISDIAERVGNEPYLNHFGIAITGQPHGFLYQESNADDALAQMRHQHWKPNQCHIGIGGFFNLDVAATGTPYVVLSDVNEAQGPFWQKIFKLVEENETRKDFAKALKASQNYIQCRTNYKSTMSTETDQELTRPGGWLSSDEKYQTVRNAVLEDRIQYISWDMTDTAKASRIRDYLNDKGLEVASMYLSNVPLLLTGQPEEGFYLQKQPKRPADKMCRSVTILTHPNKADVIASGLKPGKHMFTHFSYDPLPFSPEEFRKHIRTRVAENEQAANASGISASGKGRY